MYVSEINYPKYTNKILKKIGVVECENVKKNIKLAY